ncbi:MAG TPA: hypothetical protein VGX23_04530 [Actinocrinis sp.]|nr:hypothetical protein [Actinocrinis sp.]
MTTPLTTQLLTFATTGRFGPLRIGMPWVGMQAALRDLGLAVPETSPEGDLSDRFECLDLSVADGRLVLLGLDHDGGLAFALPEPLGTGEEQETFSRTLLIGLPEQAGCPWSDDPALAFAGQQSAIRTEAGVTLVFTLPTAMDVELPDNDELLASAYLSLKE